MSIETSSQAATSPLNTGLEPKHRICVIGDVHGEIGLMQAMILAFKDTCKDFENTKLIFLGDFINKGKHSMDCLKLASNTLNQAQRGDGEFCEVVCLQGNHEAMLRVLLHPELPTNIKNKIKKKPHIMKDLGLTDLDNLDVETLKARLGAELVGFIDGLESHCQFGNLLFVHAGTDPQNNDLEDHLSQKWNCRSDTHWCWIKDTFLDNPVQFPNLTVIHGHSPVKPNPSGIFIGRECKDGKINLDAGSYKTHVIMGAEFTNIGYNLSCAYDLATNDIM